MSSLGLAALTFAPNETDGEAGTAWLCFKPKQYICAPAEAWILEPTRLQKGTGEAVAARPTPAPNGSVAATASAATSGPVFHLRPLV